MQDLLKTRDANHLKAVEELEALYEKKLALENDKYIEIEGVLEDWRILYERQIKEKDNNHKSSINDLQTNYR